MWDRYADPREASDFMRHLAQEVRQMRHEMQDVLRMVREAEYVRQRLMRDMPGYWEDSVRLGMVRQKFDEAR